VITLPAIERQVPAVYTTATESRVAARCALLIAPKGQIAAIPGRKAPLEFAQLERALHGWMENATRGLEIFRPKAHLCVDRSPACECTERTEQPMSLWLINRDGEPWNSRWRMDRRWKDLQKAAPGMPAAALEALRIASALGLPIYTPHVALSYCSWHHWLGEDDETWALKEWEEGMTVEKAEAQGFPTRRWLEKQLPPLASEYRRGISRARLARSGQRRDVARAILELYAAIKANGPPRGANSFHRDDDEHVCIGFGLSLRWNEDDPMDRLYDDYANSMFESHHVESHYGWFPVCKPAQLTATLEAVRRRFSIARAAEKLIHLIAERSGR